MPDALSEQPLARKVALITGGGRGIGHDIALAYATAGADVAITGRTADVLDETAAAIGSVGRKALAIAGDVSNAADVERIVGETMAAFGRIDVLVNNAAVQTPIGPLWEQAPGEWLQPLLVNVGGTFLCCRAVIPHMIRQGGGKIINLSGGGDGALPYRTAYSASKAAVVRLTESLAPELAPHNIQVNAIAPGTVRTRMTEEVLDAGSRAGAAQLEDARRIDAKAPASDKAAALAIFLASDASGRLSGRMISAVWDDWRSFPDRWEEIEPSNLYTLRRVVEG